MEFLYTWLGVTILFIIIELTNSTFYGLSLALASGVTTLYVFVTEETDFTIIQGLIFVLSAAIFSYVLPKILISSSPDVPQGSDKYIGEKRSVKKSGDDIKISLDGVEYLVDSDEVLKSGDKVEIIGHKGASMKVKKVSSLSN